MDLFENFRTLSSAASDAEFAAIPIGGQRSDFLAKSRDGAPLFLISDSSAASYTPGAILKHFSIQFHATCRVQSPLGLVDGQFAIVSCDSSSPDFYELFIRCVSAAIGQLPTLADTQDIESCVRSLLNLFRAINGPGSHEIAGLWAELFVISQANDVALAVRAWHADVSERFDFSWPTGALEVKATQGTIRVHDFALEQLDSPNGFGMVASLLMEPMTNGAGVMDLATNIDAALCSENHLRHRLWANISAALGSEFGEKLDRRFNVHFAERNILLFNMGDIPAPPRPQDGRITSIRFRSNLTNVPSMSNSSPLKTLKNLFSR